ncbi:MAG: PTPA-CTERM sorting domain-containing protein [Limnothrix sp.]
MKNQLLLGAIATSAFAVTAAVVAPSASALTMQLGSYSGNDTGAMGTGVSNLNALLPDYSWSVAGKSDEGFGSFSSGGDGTKTGTWNTSLSGFGAFSVKAATGYLLFKTDDLSTIDWSTLGLLNNGGKQPGLSHLTAYIGACVANCEPPTDVPTPAAVLPILGGLFGAASRRKKGESAEA